MLSFYGSGTRGPIVAGDDPAKLPEHVHWIDAFEPTSAETAFLRTAMGARVPTLDDLVEIENSSRLSTDDGALIMSLPATTRDEAGYPCSTPVGFVVTPRRVATIRFAHLPSFENLAKQICAKGELLDGGYGATVTILEIIIDHIADLLERIGSDFDEMSRTVFQTGLLGGKGRRPQNANTQLARMLKTIGRDGDLVSKVSESMLGLTRMVQYMTSKGQGEITPELKARLQTVSEDAKSLHEFQEHLTNKSQFLLDTVLGLANIEQNNVFRVLTVVSVVGIPPTFFASLYGMNFKEMPELNWHYGYAYGLTLIFLSAFIPAVWFKVKGWW